MTLVWLSFCDFDRLLAEADSGHHNVCSPKSLAFIEPLQDILVAGGQEITLFRPGSTRLGQGL